MRLEGLGKLKKFNDLIATRTSDLPACTRRTVPTLLHDGHWTYMPQLTSALEP
jgi:hypothetical protein